MNCDYVGQHIFCRYWRVKIYLGDEELVISFSLSLGSRSGDGIGNLARVHPTVLDLLFWTVMELVV
ncbi:unnamed protein product [Trifolium pratense]|uniref:Uncharacterized protein n=1 Tax=Trifolium pratense TaxID=57577 RepID=A0ACB0I805_TRIPR|nr:unnamed protein product [Trifolium pratense]